MSKSLTPYQHQQLMKSKISGCYAIPGITSIKKSEDSSPLSAAQELEDAIKKGGEGSRGGKVIGHTKSGKPIYENLKADSEEYSDFSIRDHQDASDLHDKKSVKHYNKDDKEKWKHHHTIADSHEKKWLSTHHSH